MFDLIIIGGGAAAMSAGIYAGRKKVNTAIVAGEIGGQTAMQPEIYNYPGYLGKDGYDLVQNMKKQVKELEAVTLLEPWMVAGVEVKDEKGKYTFIVKSTDGPSTGLGAGKTIEGKSVLVATGGRPRYLGVPGEQEFSNKGVTYCATCDAPLFVGKRTAVIGGGNTGTEAALLLTKYATQVYLLHRGGELKADAVTKKKIADENGKIEVIYNALTTEIHGTNGKVTGMNYKDAQSGETKELTVDGIFIAVGFLPNSELVKGLAKLNEFGEIIVDPRTNMTSQPGLFAAGDVANTPYKQTVIATGDAAKAALSAHQWLMSQH